MPITARTVLLKSITEKPLMPTSEETGNWVILKMILTAVVLN